MRRVILWLSISMLLVAVACGGNAGPTKATGPSGQNPVRVYFVRSEKVSTAGRSVEADTKAQAIQALLAGPNEFERGTGMSTDIPAGTKLLGLEVVDDTASVNLSNDFQAGGASLSMQLRVAEIVFTLTQFDGIKQVTIKLDGKPIDRIGDGVSVTRVNRASFPDVTPRILVESPVPGATVISPLKVSGIANVFEGTVDYSVNDPDGNILDQGFATASVSMGVWGEFNVTSAFTTRRKGLGRILVWEVSQQDGSRRNVYEVPVNM